MRKTMCELFAGVGGFRLGFERSDIANGVQDNLWETVWFSQWEPGKTNQWAHDCYVAHWGDIDERTGIDISSVDKHTVPEHNVLVGGFPCQDYSVARSLSGSMGIAGKKGVLWWQICDMLEAQQASFGLFENVDRLLKSPANQRGRDFGIMLACLASLGYSCEWRVINAAEYGGPQRRRRTFIFIYKNDTVYGNAQAGTTPLDIFNADGFFTHVFPIERVTAMDAGEVTPDDIEKVSNDFKFDFSNAGYMHEGQFYTTEVTPIYEDPVPLRDILQHDVGEEFYLGEDLAKWQYLKGAKKIERTSKDGHTYTFSEGPIAFPDPIDRPARTMLTSESTLNRSTHVIEDPETHRLRLLTPLETERIQGFANGTWDHPGTDDDWTNTGMPQKFRYFCMGNALVVPMVQRMGTYLGNIVDAEP